RDILSRWRTAHIHVRRPSGVRVLTRVTGAAALDELRGFRLESTPKSKPKAKPETGNGKTAAKTDVKLDTHNDKTPHESGACRNPSKLNAPRPTPD
ncbi:hypothetical protein, partial [Lysobacter sp. Root690]|uniref:hypothetical protein n=1 Tax=Lysobacter sp. Root690 TaxID=1736588 RepID=UPI001F371AB0